MFRQRQIDNESSWYQQICSFSFTICYRRFVFAFTVCRLFIVHLFVYVFEKNKIRRLTIFLGRTEHRKLVDSRHLSPSFPRFRKFNFERRDEINEMRRDNGDKRALKLHYIIAEFSHDFLQFDIGARVHFRCAINRNNTQFVQI